MLQTAYATIKGFEVMRAFGLGTSVLVETIQFVSERLELVRPGKRFAKEPSGQPRGRARPRGWPYED